MNDTISRTEAIEFINSILKLDPPNSEFGKGCRAGLRKARDILGWEEVEAHTKNLSQIAHCDRFICEKCGIHLKDWARVKIEEYDDGYKEEGLYEYEFEYCPNCGAKVVNNMEDNINTNNCAVWSNGKCYFNGRNDNEQEKED